MSRNSTYNSPYCFIVTGRSFRFHSIRAFCVLNLRGWIFLAVSGQKCNTAYQRRMSMGFETRALLAVSRKEWHKPHGASHISLHTDSSATIHENCGLLLFYPEETTPDMASIVQQEVLQVIVALLTLLWVVALLVGRLQLSMEGHMSYRLTRLTHCLRNNSRPLPKKALRSVVR